LKPGGCHPQEEVFVRVLYVNCQLQSQLQFRIR
jgi:hypothetical protein